ncbi:amino acid ABC transporter permease [Caminibacter pacificus]|uniref:Putative glutamine transport system permease protein GlnP n=1 Tax=Caminibacter pacificus TaxID=1424653 RepID=A0AAJ4REH7_9BACT|nr:amino acid ABC transporter permease [Caminibacter pacificus]NPA87374.1 amino acid ABC transporter permease [Campylobacterota bacterium]QCI28149.1 amino acid ABC transporter permease [Caminibacter pacificus]ROR41139.1 amino acid ABC transporter membrane protein (PAAT family) [Caminibacter pacificus]
MRESIFKNKKTGLILALLFYIGLGYFLYQAASKINYTWKWDMIPKYFVYHQKEPITSPCDGKLEIKGDKAIVICENKKTYTFNIKGYKLEFKNGDYLYEDDEIAYKSVLKPGPFLMGLWVTIKISIISMVIAFIIGLIIAIMRLSGIPALDYIGSVYVTVIRGTPLLVQLFIFYFIVATIFNLPRFWAGVMSLSIFYGAYIAEILRGAIQAVDKGQHEAAKSLGFNAWQRMYYIILPQALRKALPALVGELISLIKDSSLVSIISITDLTKVGREIVANTFSPFETWLTVAALYLMLTSILSFIGHKLEKRMKVKGGF